MTEALSERRKRLARNFAAEWLRPSDPDHADPALLDTLQTTMVAFYACASRLKLSAGSAQAPETPRGEVLRDAVGAVVDRLSIRSEAISRDISLTLMTALNTYDKSASSDEQAEGQR